MYTEFEDLFTDLSLRRWCGKPACRHSASVVTTRSSDEKHGRHRRERRRLLHVPSTWYNMQPVLWYVFPCFVLFNSNVCPHSQPFIRTLYISSCTAYQPEADTKTSSSFNSYHATLIRSCTFVIYINAGTCWCQCITCDKHAVDRDVAGILMVSGWLLLISFSMIFARFYKDSAPDEMPCGVKVWFMVGRYICLKDNILIMYPKYIVYPRLPLVNQTRRMI